jgi:hypothetical protein
MKITNENIIRANEDALIRSIVNDVDWKAVEGIIEEKHQIRIKEDVRDGQGEIVINDDKLAYRVNFEVTVPFSVLFDRSGDYLSMRSEKNREDETLQPQNAIPEQRLSENEMLAELCREMGALEESEPIELTEIVGNLVDATEKLAAVEEPAYGAVASG